MEKTLCIPAILAARIKERERDKGIVFYGGPSTVISNNVILTRKGLKYYLSGEELDVNSFIKNEPNHIKNLVTIVNKVK